MSNNAKKLTLKNFSIKNFRKLPKKQQQAVYMLGVCALALTIVIVSSSVLIFGSGSKDVAVGTASAVEVVEKNYDKDADAIDTTEYEGVILQRSNDAGNAYLDDTLWVGDSNTVRMNLYGLVPLSNYMGKVGMSIEGLTGVQCVYFMNDVTVYTIPAAIAKVQPRRIIISMGTNNASSGASSSSFIKSYKAAIETIQKSYPYCDIIIAAIPPVAQQRNYPNIKQATIDELNKAIVSMCEKLDLPFLNTTEILKNTSTGYISDQYISEDGLHYSQLGVEAIMAYARTHAYETTDRRPTVQHVPMRQEPPPEVITIPEPDASSSSSGSDSSSSSSTTSSTTETTTTTTTTDTTTTTTTTTTTLAETTTTTTTIATAAETTASTSQATETQPTQPSVPAETAAPPENQAQQPVVQAQEAQPA